MEWKPRLLSYRLPPHPFLPFSPFYFPISSSSSSSSQISCNSLFNRSAPAAVRRSIFPQVSKINKVAGMSFQSTNYLRDWSERVVERRTVMDFDLNCPPPDECYDPTGPHEEAAQSYNHYQGQTMNNPDFVDEDIAIISPRKFAEARKNLRRNYLESNCGVAARRNGNTEIYDVTSWPPFTIWPSLTISNSNASIQEQMIHNLDLCLSCESSSRATKATIDTDIPCALAQSSSIPPPAAPSLRCAICIEPLVDETTTKCGHVFCRSCIETAIATQHRCPICRRKLRKRDIIRIYLPFST